MDATDIPESIRTERLLLRAWRDADALLLLPILESNGERLARWIPPHVALPAPVPELQARLSAFADDFHAERACRYGIFAQDESELYGEIDLFFRSETGRVHLPMADRVEIGYWLRDDVTGRGYATEAARAMLSLARRLPGMRRVEIRCDSRNAPSMAVAERLGFHRAAESVGSFDVTWTLSLTS